MFHRHISPGPTEADTGKHRIHLHLPKPHDHPPHHHESIYFEAGRMSREMDHL